MMLPIIWKELSKDEQYKLLQRPPRESGDKFSTKVQEIIESVRSRGDVSCREMTKKFDGVYLDCFEVQPAEFERARAKMSESTRLAILKAIDQLSAFQSSQVLKDIRVETSKGIVCESQSRPIQRVGLYIPGGSAPLVSTVLMLGVPSKIANCPMRVMCSPPGKDGTIDPNILVAAELCGIKKVYKLGGAQAIAAMAYGTETIPKVDKIFGPGNSWVTQAKILVSQDASGAAYDLPAGPSEVMVIADRDASPEFVAADLLSQAEHGNDSQVILVCADISLSNKVIEAIQRQIQLLSRRSIAEQALQNSCLIIVDSVIEAIEVANEYAPEHLIMQVEGARRYINDIQNAGSVFLGPWSPESAGDYASGTNHVLPTYGFAKNSSGLSVRDFMKTISIQELTRDGLADISSTICELATIEGLDAHKNAVDIRLSLALARSEIVSMSAYRSARSEKLTASIWLDANENPWNENRYNRYPEPQPASVVSKLSTIYDVNPGQILVTRGSDEGIDLLVRLFCRAGQDKIMICPPTYGMYKIAATIQGAEVVEVPLLKENNFSLNMQEMLGVWQSDIKVIFLCSPNNPTGNLLDVNDILCLCKTLDGKSIIVVDEAYIEFSADNSLIKYLDDCSNLVILRTLSKAYGLAGTRCGVTIANKSIIQLLKKIVAPYPIPQPIADIISRQLDASDIETQTKVLCLERERIFDFLSSKPFVKKIWKSAANFLLFEAVNSKLILDTCLSHGIVLRDRSGEYNLANCIRVTIGQPSENTLLMEVLNRV
jgi:histidinol-phosphate aminotransferase